MPSGFEVYGPTGQLRVGRFHRLMRFLGPPIVVAPGGSGSVVNDGFLQGTPFYVAAPFNSSGASYFPGDSIYPPTVSFAGNTMTYSVNFGSDSQVIQYGVF